MLIHLAQLFTEFAIYENHKHVYLHSVILYYSDYRFPPPGQRLPRGPPPFHSHSNLLNNHSTPENHDRNKYRQDHRQSSQYRPSDRSHHQSQRSIFPLLDRLRQKDTPEQSSYYDNPREPSHINSMGDVDHRQQGKVSKASDPYSRHSISPWSNPPELQKQFYDDRNKYNKHYKHHDTIDSSKLSTLDYAGHRPPASDHYGGNPNSSIDNSHSFSRSVDDTVDIVRKRLQNRNEPPPPGEPVEQLDEDLRIPRTASGNYLNITQEPPPKKRVQRQKQDRNIEVNCNKMKSKIVQQLFKMDKDRIHKLMDNPSSSSKFEYAISSLITESQNSLNKHLRSLAEKSLSSSDDFIHNDNNTIYEDTFMKQMQNILDPQDTVLLEDIKPLVLAELSKVLQINEYDQPFQIVDDQQNYPQSYDQPTSDSYSSSEVHNYEDYSHSRHSYYDQINAQPVGYEDYGNSNTDLSLLEYDQPQPVKEEPQPLFERRKARKSIDYQPEPCFSPVEQLNSNSCDVNTSGEEFPSFTSDKRVSRRSLDKQSEGKNKEAETVPVFDPNSAQFSEEDDPFAELDKQYHVAVDHNFIGIDAFGTSSPQSTNSRSSSKHRESNNKTPSKDYVNVKQEIESQLHDFAKSPIKLQSVFNSSKTETAHKSFNNANVSIKKEIFTPTKDNANSENHAFNVGVKQECNTESRNVDDHSDKSLEMTPTPPKTALSSSSRKRSTDQKPSHRKEKRKKSETSQSDSNQQILNKNIIINVNDCAAKDSEKCADSTKSIFNLFFSKNGNSKDVPKDTKKVESVEKSYSDKYVKRKESRSKSRDKGDEHKKRHSSLSTSHSTVSPKDSTNNNTPNSKSDSKTKLQNIDIFSEQPKKMSTKHQAHRNTALSPNTPTKPTEITKIKQTQITFNKKVTKRHVATQIFHKTHSRPTQTEKHKSLEKLVQTDPVSFGKTKSKATDTFERMKEIDMEIQELLQEKFKLYSSLESNPQCPSTIHTLGMTVLNMPLNEVTENDANSLSVDTIVDDFTNIPVEELEQIAMDTVNTAQTPQVEKKTRRHKISEESRASSASPTVKRSARMAAKTPNISLLEQIITDDRPLEDIISLDDLETTPVKTKKKSARHPKSKKKKTVKIDKTVPVMPSIAALPSISEYNLKECCVVLKREDLSKYTKPKHTQEEKEPIVININLGSGDPASENVVPVEEKIDNIQVTPTKSNVQFLNDSDIVEETVVENDIQFDMLDVSEDIVIGDVCEVKSGDKEAERTELAVAEEIILDNSQSSLEPVQTEGGPADNICKMYDYSTDENLRRDAVTVSGHADAVLALEVSHFFF